MLPGHVFTLANRSMKKPLLMAVGVALSFGVLLGSAPAFADPATEILGAPRDTGETDQWMVKYLGVSDNWEAARSYANGVLDDSEYVQAQAVTSNPAWVTGTPWISLEQDTLGPSGYYSYVTTINDAGITGADPTISFNGLSVSFGADDLLIAFVINGALSGGFTAQTEATFNQYEDIFLPSGVNSLWNVGGNNTVEIVVYNSEWYYGPNPTGLSVTLQAHYAPVPEPETWALLLAGLGIVGAVTRRRRITAAM